MHPDRTGHNATVPRVVPVRNEPPVTVGEAGQAFGTVLRIRLIRHYLDHPGTQRAAAKALGISAALASVNTKALMRLGVIVERDGVYQIDRGRLDELKSALLDYLDPAAQVDQSN